ncbi:hypothetical protein BSKO_11574 [Bryopsis sp. KO-2023]|nr:hypothetical protein BSKO_11574 [Bryopsis sp. KO-2023]
MVKKNGPKKGAKKEAPKEAPKVVQKEPQVEAKTDGRVAKLRKSLEPGTIVIIVAGRFCGKRAVFLKQLPSGLLLISGPFSLNGVPAKRIAQSYVIATSTKIALPKLDLSPFTDAYFTRDKSLKKKKKEGQEGFFDTADEEKKELPAPKVENQKKLDAAMLPEIQNGGFKDYLKNVFSLGDGDRPHLMKF